MMQVILSVISPIQNEVINDYESEKNEGVEEIDTTNMPDSDECPACFSKISPYDETCPNCGYKLNNCRKIL